MMKRSVHTGCRLLMEGRNGARWRKRSMRWFRRLSTQQKYRFVLGKESE